MPNQRDLITLRELVTEYMEGMSFHQIEDQFEYICHSKDRVEIFVIYVKRTKGAYSFNSYAGVQLKQVEKLISVILDKKMPKEDEATLSQSLKSGDIAYWYAYNPQEIILTYDFIKDTFASAQIFFEQVSTLDNVLEILLDKPIEPSYSQRVIGCAYLLHQENILIDISNQVRENFSHWLKGDDFKKQSYLDFLKVSDYLINELIGGLN